jgi:hypothetical protein
MRRPFSTSRVPGLTSTPAVGLWALLAALLLVGTAGDAAAQSVDPATGVQQVRIRGILQGGYLPSFQDTDQGGHSLDDGQGLEVEVGFATGDTFAWLLGYQLSMASNYNTHFFPFSMRMYSPELLDIARLYGQVGLGLFFSQVSGKHGSADNERAAAWRIGGGVEVDIMKDLSGYINAGWTNGLGSADSFKYGTVGVGLIYRWDI